MVEKRITELTPERLNQMILHDQPFFLLDVRNEKDFNDWKIEGKHITYLNVPYFELLDGVEPILDKLPADKPIVVVCAKEGSSVFVANMLAEKGIDVSYLKGGMKGWSDYLYPTVVYQDSDMKVYQMIRVGKGCLSYMIISGKEALVVDPSRFENVYLDIAEKEKAAITNIVDTHLHADHISGGRELSKETQANYYLMKSEGAVFDFHPLENHDRIAFANVVLEVIALKTPGHTPGSISLLVNRKLLLSGDTVFVSGLGRPDLGGKVREWAKDLYNTVYQKIARIADNVLVLPAHYASIIEELNDEGYIGDTLGHIRNANDMMQGIAENDFVDKVETQASTATPPNFEKIIAINRGVGEATIEEKQELEIGPNRCALHHTH